MSRSRVVIVGAGFAGYQAARALTRHRALREETEIVLINPTDYFLYLPLLPQVSAGVLEPRRVAVSLPSTLPKARLVLGEVDGVDLDRRTVSFTGPEGDRGSMPYDRLVLTVGSVNKLLPIPGVAEHAHGFRGMPEALYLRDHITRQIELAGGTDDPAECAARCAFVVVGAGYTGTEVAAQGKLYTDALVKRHRVLRHRDPPRWLLLDIAERVLPELDPRLSRTADKILRQRGWRCGPATPSRRPPRRVSCSTPVSSWPPTASSGASGCAPTRWSPPWDCRRNAAVSWSART